MNKFFAIYWGAVAGRAYLTAHRVCGELKDGEFLPIGFGLCFVGRDFWRTC